MRPLELQDLPVCVELLYDRSFYEESTLAELPRLWRRLLQSGSAIALAVLDKERPENQRLVGFGFNLIVKDHFLDWVRANRSPGLPGEIVQALESYDSPLLPPAEIRRANGRAGLNLLMWQGGIRIGDWTGFRLICDAMIEGFDFMHFGYQWEEILGVVCGDMWGKAFHAGGHLLRADWQEFYPTALEPPAPEKVMRIFGMTRQESAAVENFSSRIAPLFVYHPPRFGFRPVQQELLFRALLGENDEEAAQSLGISLHTVKTRWKTILERIEEVNPFLSGLGPESEEKQSLGRGTTKRFHLLRYLQNHLEELRPHAYT